ncbi:MAG: response regulator transcription factor [Ignavibacteriae bacterium]|nr:response regulator transcription factor [Ignavibacteriota bacterium]
MNNSFLQHQPVNTNVWIIEDHHETRKTLVSQVQAIENYRCTLAVESCEEAFKVLKTSEPPHIILLDIHLPGMSGLQGLNKFKKHSPGTHVIFMTVNDELEAIIYAMNNGASGYYWKGAQHYNIEEMMRDVMNGGCPMDAFTAKKIIERNKTFSRVENAYDLSERELQILQLFAGGKTAQQIANELFLSYNTVNDHRKHIYEKLHVHNRAEATSKALREGLLDKTFGL